MLVLGLFREVFDCVRVRRVGAIGFAGSEIKCSFQACISGGKSTILYIVDWGIYLEGKKITE